MEQEASYRQKPIIVKAWQWNGENYNKDFPFWIKEQIIKGKLQITFEYRGQTYITIDKGIGSLRVNVGDYIVMGVNGGIYPCKKNTFLQTHERV